MEADRSERWLELVARDEVVHESRRAADASNEAQRLESAAAADSDHAKSANESADNYMLAVVLFATSLFFAGISTKMRSARAQVALLGLGCVVFLGTLIWALTLPVHLAT